MVQRIGAGVRIRRLRILLLIAGWLAAIITAGHARAVAAPQSSAASVSPAAAQRAILQRYCLTCHNQNSKDLGTVPIALDTLDLSKVGANAETWERVVRKVRTGVMPPAGRPRPDAAAHTALVTWLENELDRAASANPNPGRTQPFHRLNRSEYRNAIHDLLDLDVQVDSLLPADDASYGFDNIAGVLKMSPTLMERYFVAAQKISRLAVGTPAPSPNVDYIRLEDDLQQDEHIEGLPIGTRGGASLRYHFPMDGEYVIKVRLARDILENVPVFPDDQRLEVALDGERLQLFTLAGFKPPPAAAPAVSTVTPATGTSSEAGSARAATQPQRGAAPAAPAQGRGARPRPQISQVDTGPRLSAKEREQRNHVDDKWDVRVRVKAGDRQLNVAFIKLSAAIDETARLPFIRPYAANVNTPDNRMGVALRSVEIAGPYNPTGPGESASRRRIFVCEPPPRTAPPRASATPNGGRSPTSSETDCARRILTTLARRAYRRPVSDADVKPLLALYADGTAEGGFDVGIERAVKRLLVGPEFLFRVERDPDGIRSNTPYRISDLELASRLSFFLWSSIPDDELLEAGSKRTLRDPAVLEQQVRRMVSDPRFETFVKNFAGQWLYLRNLPTTAPVAFNFPDFDEALRASMQRETELFFDSIIREDRSTLDLLTADYTFLNERLARHYGIPGVKGTHFRRVTHGADSDRRGLLGQGSILTVTSHPDRTSPVVRGKWILENLLGTTPPPPPANINIPELKAVGEGGAVLSMRDRMAQHRANPACAGCHAIMDPIGFSLENFDAVGKARTLGESSEPIDASGALPDGTTFAGAAGLRRALLGKSDLVVTTVTEKLLTYALGRGLEYYDAPTVRGIVRATATNDYRFTSGLIMEVVKSAPFQMRRSQTAQN